MGENIMSNYKSKKILRQSISLMYAKGYKKEPNTLKTYNALLRKLEKYDKVTQKVFLEQIEKVGFTPSEALTYIRATERYNRNRQNAYKIAVEKYALPKWEAKMQELTPAQRARIFDDKGGLTQEGEQMKRRFIESKISSTTPMSDKSIIIGDWQATSQSKERIIETRMRAGMPNYIDEQTQRYIDNYLKALREKRENPEWYINKFNSLTNEQKLALIREGGDLIKDVYKYDKEQEAGYLALFTDIFESVYANE